MPTEIPIAILEAAQEIDNWAKENGLSVYEIGPVCSRNHAEILRNIKAVMEVDYSNVQLSPSGKIVFYGFPKDNP
jgi:hypothetical protein